MDETFLQFNFEPLFLKITSGFECIWQVPNEASSFFSETEPRGNRVDREQYPVLHRNYAFKQTAELLATSNEFPVDPERFSKPSFELFPSKRKTRW